eukprot:TRINITY_DN25546_c0_g1_i2.p1 TRINITY_DN25546_c0_g1~~TRINITY_DN25546_c0_g1_i2.p1  ORF type:complete len:495 (+),score=73.18 TRINITY_DN25546_c0_g1_i2:107-1591(+)
MIAPRMPCRLLARPGGLNECSFRLAIQSIAKFLRYKSYPVQRPFSPEVLTKVCLIGSTGNGKSALGNFLLDPLENHRENPTFKVGETNKSCTSSCSVQSKGLITVMDTPGLNESHSKDLQHMIGVVESLHKIQALHAVVLVIKFESRMDQTYQDTVKYYESLMGPAFVSNLIVVLTAYDPAAKKYKRHGDPRVEMEENIQKSVRSLLPLQSLPLVFSLDAMLESDDHINLHQDTRKQIIQHASKQVPVQFEGLRVRKTPQIARDDEALAMKLEGQKSVMTDLLASCEATPSAVKEQVNWLLQDIAHIDQEIATKRADIKKYDNQDLHEVCRWSRSVQPAVFESSVIKFRITTPNEIQIRDKRVSYNEDYVRLEEDPSGNDTYEGRFKKIFKFKHWKQAITTGIEIKLFAWKKEAHARDILDLKSEVETLEKNRSTKTADLTKIQKEYPEIDAPVARLRKDIEEIEGRIATLRDTHMTIHEAKQRISSRADQDRH